MTEAIAHFGRSERTLRRWVDQGRIEARREGGRVLLLVHTGKADTDRPAAAAPDRTETADIMADITPAELARLREELEGWKAEAERAAREGVELWDKWSQAQEEIARWKATAERWEAVAGERQAVIDYLRSEARNAWAALATALAKIPAIEAGESRPEGRRRWWEFWKG